VLLIIIIRRFCPTPVNENSPPRCDFSLSWRVPTGYVNARGPRQLEPSAAVGHFIHVYVDHDTGTPVRIPAAIRAVHERFA